MFSYLKIRVQVVANKTEDLFTTTSCVKSFFVGEIIEHRIGAQNLNSQIWAIKHMQQKFKRQFLVEKQQAEELGGGDEQTMYCHRPL